jgi:GNAT superfamily N-acetyltransferase
VGDCTIRLTTPVDAAALPDVERSAAQSFRQIPDLAWIADDAVTTAERHAQLCAAGTCWVCERDGKPVGFLCAEIFDAELHIWELAVHQDHQGQGLGRALLRAAIAAAADRGLEAVTLSTFRDVLWNEPFYVKLGFNTLDAAAAGPRLTAILHSEVEQGLPGERRCAMRLTLKACA